MKRSGELNRSFYELRIGIKQLEIGGQYETAVEEGTSREQNN
jgi:hypothetical protein